MATNLELDDASQEVLANILRTYLEHSPRLTNHPAVVAKQVPPLPPINETRRRIVSNWIQQL